MSELPGASYQVTNTTLVTLKRTFQQKVLGLEEPIRLLFNDTWKRGNSLFDWYERRTNRTIKTIQLRKEHKSPFFHEYISFSLRDNHFFRIDRRQMRDESVPLDSIQPRGVEAFDSIDNISSLDNDIYGASDCLVEVTFNENVEVHLMLLLRICRAISQHPGSRVYTVQRYNCYFFAQTILFCTICAVCDWDGTQTWVREHEDNVGQWKSPNSDHPDIIFRPSKSKTEDDLVKILRGACPIIPRLHHDWTHLSRAALDLVQTSPFLIHVDNCASCRKSQSLHQQRSMSSQFDRLNESLSSHWDTVYRSYVDQVYDATYKEVVCSGIWQLESCDKPIEMCRQLMTQEAAKVESIWHDCHKRELSNLISALRRLLEPTIICDAWEPGHDVCGPNNAPDTGIRFERTVKEWEDKITPYFTSAFPAVKQALEEQVGELCTQAYQSAIAARLGSFKQRMVIKQAEIKAATKHHQQKDLNELAPAPDEQTTSSDKNVERRFTWWSSSRRSKYGALREVQIGDLQDSLNALIDIHGLRVERYKALLGCSANDVTNEVRAAMNDIWTTIVYESCVYRKD